MQSVLSYSFVFPRTDSNWELSKKILKITTSLAVYTV